ncbi:hypothetical protein DU000_06540 [Parvibium lacunae]|uniref:Uncharacterized protein n=2 Tax=Parvibium lacunae TaxID=1888893 RepID=A0A368L573_9BURK|nr:hypothetical protein DU000_06540 [Parvibium lacunae]
MLSIVCTGAVLAQTATPGIDKREANQERRIQQGEQSGALTNREAARLERREARLDRHQAKAEADGVVTRQERRELRREENRDSRAIYRQKHDRQHN